VKALFVSNLFPDTREPHRGIYNARLVRSLSSRCEVQVISPRPALPFFNAPPRAPLPEDAPLRPTYPAARYLPKIGSPFNHRLMARALRPSLIAARQQFPFDIVVASWLYPDASGISILARELNFPFVAVCQGSDAHQYLGNATRRRIIVESMSPAAAVVARSDALTRLLANAGIPNERLHTIYNGVDLDLFHPIDKGVAREALNLPLHDKTILFIGNFYSVKNPKLLACAYRQLCARRTDRRYRLVMIGDGPERQKVIRSFVGTGFEQTTRFPGRLPPQTVARYLQAADALCVPSDNEGVPNVILEAFASGVKVVATDVGGIPEILTQPFLGSLTPKGDATTMAETLRHELEHPSDTSQIVKHASRFSWDKTADSFVSVLRRASEEWPRRACSE